MAYTKIAPGNGDGSAKLGAERTVEAAKTVDASLALLESLITQNESPAFSSQGSP
jgi:hypothetical protein